ncbi:thiamine diphosphokinase [Mucilaginibacter daejeonensis]|uniref:thiamine diphosphokinase n=1 Tax=Mucilaginibacter daejeonensis TaxID=398049 RepID=UPI001D17BD0F|nr:thiamine diphosphokinase [Mucilaginibacter daejeonensis]UEG53523.1 thiamine diphosphokinase [Mucilaginibacter daejeonensis]
MSSHHIVREKQEPALLVLGLGHLSDDEFGQLLEWSPTLIATPPVAEQLAAYGIKIDALITDDTHELPQDNIKLIAPNGASWLEAGIDHLVSHGYPAVNIVTEEFEVNNFERYASQINMVILHNGQKIYAVSPGFSKWKPAGEPVRILSQATGLITEGLTHVKDGYYRTEADGFFTLRFDEPYVFIAEEH